MVNERVSKKSHNTISNGFGFLTYLAWLTPMTDGSMGAYLPYGAGSPLTSLYILNLCLAVVFICPGTCALMISILILCALW